MTILLGLSMLVSVLAVSIPDNRRRTTPLEVTVESVGNSALKASITNTGSEPLRLLKTGSILDSAAIERAEIYSGCKYPKLGEPLAKPLTKTRQPIKLLSTESDWRWHNTI